MLWSLVLGLVLILIFYRRQKEFERCLLSAQVESAKKGLLQQTQSERLRNKLALLYYPSFLSVTLPLIAAIATALTGTLISQRWNPIDPGWLTDSISIEIGISALLFPIVILIVELAGEKEEGILRKSEILLRGTYLFPISMFALFELVTVAFFHGLRCAWLIIVITAILFSYLFYRTIQLLLNPEAMRAIGLKSLKDRVSRALSYTVDQRIANGILMTNLAEIGITPIFFRNEEWLPLYVAGGGVVTDVNLCLIKRMVGLIQSHATSNLERSSDVTLHPVELKHPKIFFTAQIGSEIHQDDDSRCVFGVDGNSVKLDQHTIKALERMAVEAVKVSSREDYERQFGSEMTRLKDFMLDAIREKKTGAIEMATKDYANIMEFFLLGLTQYKGGAHTAGRAYDELHRIGGGWSIVEVIVENISEFFQRALETNDFPVIRLLAITPISIAIKAITFRDHYLFQRFIAYPTQLYSHIVTKPNLEIRNALLDRAWRYVMEVADYHIERILTKKETDQQLVQDRKDFALELLMVFQTLMKTAVDHGDIKALDLFESKLMDCFKRFTPSLDMNNLKRIDLLLYAVNIDPQTKTALAKMRELQKVREEAETEINTRKRLILFGLTAWVLRLHNRDASNAVHREILQSLSHHLYTSSIDELTVVFLKSMEVDDSRDLGWDWWELETRGLGTTHRMDTSDFLQKVYVIGLLKLLKPGDKLPASRHLADLVGNDKGTIRLFLDQIKAKPETWQWILPQDYESKIAHLFKVFDDLVTTQKSNENKEIMNATLSSSKITEFTKAFLKGYADFSGLFFLIHRSGIIHFELNSIVDNKMFPAWGFNQIFDKEAFVEAGICNYGTVAEQYGQAMAQDENNSFLSALSENLQNFNPDPQELSSLPIMIRDAAKRLREQGVKPNCLITTLNFSDLDILREADDFIPSWDKDCPVDKTPGYLGVYKLQDKWLIPAYDARLRRQDSRPKGTICLCDIKLVGQATYYSPALDPEESGSCIDKFLFRVVDLNGNGVEREKILAADPPWLSAHPNKNEYLRMKVELMIFERLSIDFRNAKAAGYVFHLRSINEDLLPT